MRWVGRVTLAIVLLLGTLAIAGAAYQQVGMWRDARRFPEPGRLVNAGKLRLQMNCTGIGPPTVVLDSGLGDLLPEWERVQGAVAGFARVCSYDRAGYGDSDAGSMPRTSAQIATELHNALQGSDEQPPYVLVGHSFGGYNVRVFTGEYPSEVAGIVLVDSPQEDQYKMLPGAWEKFSVPLQQRYSKQAATAPFFVGLGIARLMLWSQDGAGKYDYLILQSKYLKARASELENIQSSAEEARSAGGIADKPLIVLTAGKTLGATFISGLDEQGVAQYERIWVQDLQPRLVGLSTRGRQIVLPNADHNIPAERPETIVAAVREICTTVVAH